MPEQDTTSELTRIARELASIRQLVVQVVQYIRDAESEVPERMRRFANYMHDIHDIKYMYEEHGQPPPTHILSEVRRLDDRFRQLLKTENAAGGTFEKVRRQMAADPENRYDHTLLLPKATNGEAT